MTVSLFDESFSTRFSAPASFKSPPEIGELATEYGLLCKLQSELNGDLAIITNFKDDGQGSRALEHLEWFLSLPLTQKLELVNKAASHKVFKRFFSQFNCRKKATESFLSSVSSIYERSMRFNDALSVIGLNAKTVVSLIHDFESLDACAYGHERLFERMLGLTDVSAIECAIPKSTEQNTWQGACEGRYAYASSMARLKRFYDHMLPTKCDVVYDLGSGYGHSLFYGALKFPDVSFKGVEFVCERVMRSNQIVNCLELKNIQFYTKDIRDFDFSDGTVFYLYSPFTREIKIETFNRLIKLGQEKKIRLFLYDTDQLGLFEKQPSVFRQVSDEIFESFGPGCS